MGIEIVCPTPTIFLLRFEIRVRIGWTELCTDLRDQRVRFLANFGAMSGFARGFCP